MPFQWVRVNPERLEYCRGDEQSTCVGEVIKRCGSYYEAVVFKKGQRSSRLSLHRGESTTVAMDAIVRYFQGTTN